MSRTRRLPGLVCAAVGALLAACDDGTVGGSAEELTYDPGSHTGTERSSFSEPAVVAHVDDEQLGSLEVTPTSAEEGSVDDFDSVRDDHADAATLAASRVYYVRFRIEYVDGVAATFVAPGFGLASGSTDLPALHPTTSGGPCTTPEVTEPFGRGSRLEGCVPIFLPADSAEPDTLTWSDSFEGVVEVLARWPLPGTD